MNFAGLKRYKWAPSSPPVWQDSLVEKNIQFIAGKILEQKGYTKTENPDFLISTNYDYEIGCMPFGYKVRALTLNAMRADTKQVIWKGTAVGDISTDSYSGDLRKSIENIFLNFPQKWHIRR
jgi:hypothetical protein